MVRLANISGKQAVRAFIRAGWQHVHTSGDHAILQKSGAPTLSIPLHKEISPFLLRKQIKRADISIAEFRRLLKGKKR